MSKKNILILVLLLSGSIGSMQGMFNLLSGFFGGGVPVAPTLTPVSVVVDPDVAILDAAQAVFEKRLRSIAREIEKVDKYILFMNELLGRVNLENQATNARLTDWSLRAFNEANAIAHLGKREIPAVIEQRNYVSPDQKYLWKEVKVTYYGYSYVDHYEREITPAVPGFNPDHRQYLEKLVQLYYKVTHKNVVDPSYSLLHFVGQHWNQFEADQKADLQNFTKDSRADFTKQDAQGNLFFHYAAPWIDQIQLQRYLKRILPDERKAVLLQKNNLGASPLALMLAEGRLLSDYLNSLVPGLLTQQELIEYRDLQGNSLLHYAARAKSIEVISWLKVRGVVSSLNQNDETPWCVALQQGNDLLEAELFNPDEQEQGILLQSALMGNAFLDPAFLTLEFLFHKNKEGKTPQQWLEDMLALPNLPVGFERDDLEQKLEEIKEALDQIQQEDLNKFDGNNVDKWLKLLQEIKAKYADQKEAFKAFLARLNRRAGNCLFLYASRDGDVPLLEFLIAEGFKYDEERGGSAPFDKITSPFEVAVKAGHARVKNVQFFVSQPDFRRKAGDYALVRETAAKAGGSDEQKAGWTKVKKKLIEIDSPLGNDPLREDDRPDVAQVIGLEESALHYQAFFGNIDYFNNPENLTSKDINAKDVLGNAPLHYALKSGNPDVVRKLLELGADVELANEQGNTPLHIACIQEDAAMIAVLTEKAPHFKKKNKRGEDAAVLLNHPHADQNAHHNLNAYVQSWQEMVDDGYDELRPKRSYVKRDDESFIPTLQGRYENLMEHNPVSAPLLFELPVTGQQGDTLLHRAVKDNNVEVVQVALSQGEVDLDLANEAHFSVRELIDRVGNPVTQEMANAKKPIDFKAEMKAALEEKAKEKIKIKETPLKVDQPVDPEDVKKSFKKAGMVTGSALGVLGSFIFFNKVRTEYARLLFLNNREIKKTGGPLYEGNLWLLATKNVIIHFFNPPDKKKSREEKSEDKVTEVQSESVVVEGPSTTE